MGQRQSCKTLRLRFRLLCRPRGLLAAWTMRLLAHQVHPAAYAWHAKEHPPRSNFEHRLCRRRSCPCSVFGMPLMDRRVALTKTLPVSRLPSAVVTGLESRLIHPRKLARHDGVPFTMSLRTLR